jgi:hypothetical protein
MRKSQAEINQWIREQEVRLGIDTGGNPPVKPQPTVTVMLPSMAAVTRVAHAAADAKIAVDPRYAAMCERLDAELAKILDAGFPTPLAGASAKLRRGVSARSLGSAPLLGQNKRRALAVLRAASRRN